MSDNNKEQKIKCQKGYYQCSGRRSMHSFVSAILFVAAIIGLVWGFLNGSLPWPSSNIEDPELTSQFKKVYLFIFILPFVLHWARIYFSFIEIDEEPGFYRTILRHLGDRKKYFEWFLRVSMLLILVWFVQSMRVHNEEFDKTTFIRLRFLPILCLYVSLLTWDIFLFSWVPVTFSCRHPLDSYKQLENKDKDRIKWAFNDILGLLMAFVMIFIEAQIVTKANMIYFSATIGVMGVIALILLVGDFAFNYEKYRKCISRSLFPNYGEINCSDSDTCPWDT